MYVTVKGNVKVAATEVEVDPADVLKACSRADLEAEVSNRGLCDDLVSVHDPECLIAALEIYLPRPLQERLERYCDEPVLDQGHLDRWKVWAASDL